MVRFFTSPQNIYDDTIRLSAEDAEHIRSLRLRPTEEFIVCDGAGSDYICRLGQGGTGLGNSEHRDGSISEIVDMRPSHGEPTVMCSVYIALAKGDRLEYAVQKSVELGAHDIVLFVSERCVSIPADITKKIPRLRRISLETAKQCGRGIIQEVTALGSFVAAITSAASAGLPLFLYECEDRLHLRQALEHCGEVRTVSIVTGPEGGFEPHEADAARSAGLVAVTLGPRILRCETAPAAALAAVMYHTDNF